MVYALRAARLFDGQAFDDITALRNVAAVYRLGRRVSPTAS